MPATITPNARKIFDARYIDPSDGGIEGLWDRCSMGNPEYREMLEELLFLPNSPTLMNLGLPYGGTLSACFVFDAEDSLLGDWPDGGLSEPAINSILGTNFKASCVAKAGGGVGYYLGNIRPKGAPIKSTHKKACGPVTVLKYYNFLRSLITQGGKRDLAQMGVLDAHHPDIREFIHVKDDDPQALSSFNISVSWRNKMLDRIDWDQLRDTVWQYRQEGTRSEETALWWEQCTSAWKHGCPGNLFWDTINLHNATPHLGNINATNPCGETPNLSNEPCNLGSLAVCRFLEGVGRKAKFAWDKFRAFVRRAICYMDDILDANKFPHPDITRMALLTRKLGLGVMGWADLLALMHVPYDSDGAVDLADELMKVVNDSARDESRVLAELKKPYPAWETAPETVKARFPRLRNSTRTSIAPTGTIAILADVWGSIEPHYALECSRTTYEGLQLSDGVPTWVREKLHDYADFKPKVASEIDYRWHIKHQAAFQKHTDLGVSKTINLPNSATVADVSEAYHLMWKSGCKGGTIYRDGCRNEQVLVKKTTSVYTLAAPVRRELKDDLTTIRHKFKVGTFKVYLHVGLYEDGTPGEIFLRVSPQLGGTVDGMLDAFAKTFSLALQAGTPLADLVKVHKGARFEPNGYTGKKDIAHCTSIPDYVARWLELRFLKAPSEGPKVESNGHQVGTPGRDTVVGPRPGAGEYCPLCQTEMWREAGCLKCPAAGCGFSNCG